MELFIAQALNGLIYGVLLFLLSAGLTLVFGLMNVLSMVHGSILMVSALLALTIWRATGSFWLALLIVPLAAGVFGAIIERLFIRQVYRAGHLAQMLVTIGFFFVIQDVSKWIWGSNIQTLPVPSLVDGSVSILGVSFPAYRLFIIGIGSLLALLLWLFIDRSHYGAMVRAGVDDADTARGVGINVPRLFTLVFGLSCGLVGIAGVVAGPIVGIHPDLDVEFTIPAFIVIVIGGVGSLRGAFFSSILVGEVDALGRAYFPDAALFSIYLLMIVVLLAKPGGLFGRAAGNRG